MADNYKSFTYKGISLSTSFNGFIINEGNDLIFFNPSQFSHEFTTPQFGNQSYFMGTNKENREFNFPILLQAQTLLEYKNFLRWLNPTSEGMLSFDYNNNFGYNVKVNSISEAKFTVNKDCIGELTYNIELEIGFITKNDWAATLSSTITSTTLPSNGNSIYLSETASYTTSSTNAVLKISNSSGTYTFTNYCNLDCYLEIQSSSISALSISSGTVVHYHYTGSNIALKLYTEYGIAVDNSGNFISLTTNLGSLPLPSLSSTVLNITSTGILTVLPIIREII